jgi:endoglucanase
MADLLVAAGVDRARGLALNVSNYHSTELSVGYAQELSDRLGGKSAVIDTSRSGAGSNGEWCNAMGRALGPPPSHDAADPAVDAYLWVKTPGESDGECNGGPSAGEWWPEYALDLAARAAY